MADIIQVKGNVQYQITLDPGVWIFDDRKKRIDQFFEKNEEEDELLAYQKQVGKQWDRELKEGAIPTGNSEKAFVYKKDISGDWGIPFAPFLKNSTPNKNAEKVICHLENGDTITIGWDEVLKGILWFAIDGKPIREEGPVYFLYGDGSNRLSPIKGITAFEVV